MCSMHVNIHTYMCTLFFSLQPQMHHAVLTLVKEHPRSTSMMSVAVEVRPGLQTALTMTLVIITVSMQKMLGSSVQVRIASYYC